MFTFFFIMMGMFCAMMFVKHPFGLGALLLVVSIIFGWWLSMNFVSWYGFMLFLIFVGGLLVLFSYTCALSPFNYPIKLMSKKSGGKIFGTLLMLGLCMLVLLSGMLFGGEIMESFMDGVSKYGSNVSSKQGVLMTTFLWDVSIVWFMLMLFLVMVLVAYVCKKQAFPLRFFSKK